MLDHEEFIKDGKTVAEIVEEGIHKGAENLAQEIDKHIFDEIVMESGLSKFVGGMDRMNVEIDRIGKEAEIRRIVTQGALEITKAVAKAFPRKRIFPKRDRLERMRRRDRIFGGIPVMASFQMTFAQVLTAMFAPIPKYPEGRVFSPPIFRPHR